MHVKDPVVTAAAAAVAVVVLLNVLGCWSTY